MKTAILTLGFLVTFATLPACTERSQDVDESRSEAGGIQLTTPHSRFKAEKKFRHELSDDSAEAAREERGGAGILGPRPGMGDQPDVE